MGENIRKLISDKGLILKINFYSKIAKTAKKKYK